MERDGERQTLEALDQAHGEGYDIWVRGGKWYARRVDGTGQALTGDTPDELDAAIREDAGHGQR
jgi:hypothetical protein